MFLLLIFFLFEISLGHPTVVTTLRDGKEELVESIKKPGSRQVVDDFK